LLKICSRKSKTVLSALISNLENMLSGPGTESIFNLERIITSRLDGYVETNDILDEEQEGFRHYRSTTNTLLQTCIFVKQFFQTNL
jgi:hypothetical protein